jgi:hypothetical protein
MSFLSPLWLFSIVAISIPVLIHLWNIRPGKTLKVGSIALIDTSSRKNSRSFNLLELLLLLLRCLLLILVAFVLATPFLKTQAITGKSKGWLLISKSDFHEAYQRYKHKADSLVQAGYELHYFNAGFQKTTILQAAADTTNQNAETATPYWNLLQQLNYRLPAAVPVYIITPNSLNSFTNSKPNTALKLHWLTYTAKDSTATWIQRAWFTENKDIHIVSGASQPSGTVYHTENIKQSAIENSPYALNIHNGRPFISIKNSTAKPVEIDTAVMKIDILAGANASDAGYIRAALQSISQFTQQNILVTAYNSNHPTKKNWLFWLTDQPLDQATLNYYDHILIYENGKPEAINSIVNTGSTKTSPQAISLYKTITAKTYPGEAEWTDGYGTPILSDELTGTTHLHHFFSHFNPAWNDLVWNAGFPQIICQLIEPLAEYPDNVVYDKRTISDKQLQPEVMAGGHVSPTVAGATTAITHYFWLLLVLIFIMERWLAHKNQLER